MEPNQKKANGLALIPFAVFVGVYLATGITLNAMGVEMAFYQLPTPIASFIGIIVAFAMFKGKFDDKLSVFLHGCGEENIMIMCMVFLFAGAFTSVSSAMGGGRNPTQQKTYVSLQRQPVRLVLDKSVSTNSAIKNKS